MAVSLVLLSAAPGVDGGWAGRGVYVSGSQPGGESRSPTPGSGSHPDSGGTEPGAVPPGSDGVTTRVCRSPGNCVDEQLLYITDQSKAPPSPKHAAEPGKSDVARFLVGTPGVQVEPGAWTVAGAETNFMATSAGERTQSGTLLGQHVTVHFAPVAYRWVYGDGGKRTTTVPGASWQASAARPFADTPTSHVFANRGSYTVTVTVDFRAEYEFAGEGWRSIAGTVALTSNPVTVTVKGVKTVLVGHDCAERPAAPGCEL